MDEIVENKNTESKSNKNKILIAVIIVSSLVILGCAGYLANSFYMLKKYDVNSFKLDKFEIPTFNSALKSKKKLVAAFESKDKITLKYDIKKIKLNDVYAYLEKLSLDGYTIVNLEDLYIRVVKVDDDIQIRIRMGDNHLVFEYNIGIDYDEPDSSEKEKSNEKKDDEKKETNDEEKEKLKIE